jgi:hypothetical protein
MPPPPVKITASEIEFLMYVGYCITTWADVEEKLFDILWKCLKCPPEQAAIVYYRTPNLDGRLSLTDELVKHALPKPKRKSGGHPHPDVKQWNELEAKFRQLLSVRRRIAHHPFHSMTFPASHGLLSGYTSVQIWISEEEKLRGKADAVQPLLLGDLKAHHILILDLASSLAIFAETTLAKYVQ